MKSASLLTTAIIASIQAGHAILEVYNTVYSIELKDDKSPLTIADKLAHEKITEHLLKTELPVLSEEGKSIPFAERKSWKRFWLVDPLDGTKEFIKKNGEFTVNIALIENGIPVLGVIYVPVSGDLYFGSSETGSYFIEAISDRFNKIDNNPQQYLQEIISYSKKIPVTNNNRPFTVVASRSHPSRETESFLDEQRKKHGNINLISKGSSLKICLVARGEADVYPRLAPTMEWDTAAGHAIAVNAGCTVTIYPGSNEVTYNKENLLNPHFIVARQ